jgi:hypothetical protein
MKRRLINFALFVPLLACLLGADSIGWAAGQPNPNPGGANGTVEGKGPYAVDPANTFGGVTFYARQQGVKLPSFKAANANKGNWDALINNLGPGTYDCWAQLDTTDPNSNIISTFTKISTVNVK